MVETITFAKSQPSELKKSPLRDGFMRWQCRVRQIAMRDNLGRPDETISPIVTVQEESQPIGQIITVLSKWGPYSKVPELQHIAKRTNDPAQKRDKAIEFLSEYYYQNPSEFSDTLTATFTPNSATAEKLLSSKEVTLEFEAYNQKFQLRCGTKQLQNYDELFQATWWHNLLFNPDLHPKTIVLAFIPDWITSSADPEMH